jgi:hypothetical protein
MGGADAAGIGAHLSVLRIGRSRGAWTAAGAAARRLRSVPMSASADRDGAAGLLTQAGGGASATGRGGTDEFARRSWLGDLPLPAVTGPLPVDLLPLGVAQPLRWL